MALTNYGNTVVLTGANRADTKVICEGWPPGLRPVLNLELEAQRLGAWVLTLRATPTIEGGGLEVNAAIADVFFGTGGLNQRVRVSIWPDVVLQLPSTTTRVEVKWDPDLPATYTLPQSVKIEATLQRSFERSHARYLRWLPRIFAASGTGLANIAIPPFADAVRPYGDELTSIAFSSDVQWSFLPGGSVRSGQNLGAVAARGAEYEFGAGLSAVTGNIGANFGAFPFTVPGTWGLNWRISL